MTNHMLILLGGNVVLLLWVVSGIVGTVTGDYEMMRLVTPVMLIYAGYLFGKPLFDRSGNGKN